VCLAVPRLGAQGAGAEPPQEAPSPVEQAVMEHRCSLSRVPGVSATDAYQACLAAQIRALRADFGTDLKRLSAAERRSLDVRCSRIRGAEGRDAYVRCLSEQLAVMHTQRAGTAPAAPTVPVAAEPASAAVPIPAPAVENPAAASGLPIGWLVVAVGAIGVVVAASAGAVKLRKQPRAAACRNCGATFGEPGELCPRCRHEAADALRRSHAEREERERAQAEERQRAAQAEEQQQRQRALEQERWEREQQTRARDEAIATEREAERRRQEELRERNQFGAELAADSISPRAILGVAADAGADEIRAAYEAARAKYDAELVAHLSEEVQAHYRAKAEAAERAYRTLTGQV
jgi:hypothetical protein